MSRVIRICADVLAFCLTTLLIAFPAITMLLQLGFALNSLFDWGELYWAGYLALRRGDASLIGVISIIWLFASPFIAFVLFKPVRNSLKALLRMMTGSPAITDISIGPKEEAIERSRLTQSETLKPFDEALAEDKPRHAARALLAWYAAWVGLKGDSEASRLCHDAVLLQTRFDRNTTEIEAYLPIDRVAPIRMALVEAVRASVSAPVRGERSLLASAKETQSEGTREDIFERDPFLGDDFELTEPEQKSVPGVADPVFDDPFFDDLDREYDPSSVDMDDSASDTFPAQQEHMQRTKSDEREDNPFDDEPDDDEIQSIVSMEVESSKPQSDENPALIPNSETESETPQLWKLIEVDPDTETPKKEPASVSDLLVKLERIDAEATSLVLERDKGGETSLSPLLSALVELGIEVSLLDELARGRLTAALREPSRASQRSFRDVALKVVSLDKSAQIDLLEEELLKIETDLATDDEDEDY